MHAAVSHEDATIEELKEDPQAAAAYLRAVLEDGDQKELMLALRRISTAFGGPPIAGIQAAHAPRLSKQLAHLNQAQAPRDMNLPGWKLHPLSGGLEGHWAVTVSGNWRLTFRFDDGDAILVGYQVYH